MIYVRIVFLERIHTVLLRRSIWIEQLLQEKIPVWPSFFALPFVRVGSDFDEVWLKKEVKMFLLAVFCHHSSAPHAHFFVCTVVETAVIELQ
jgi:hypothetical protein